MPENRVARIDQREIGGGICLRAGVRLHVRVRGAEEFLRAIDRELLGDVDILASAVVALARIAFGVLVGQHRALRFQHARTCIVLGSDELDMFFLTATLGVERSLEFGVETGDGQIRRETCESLGLRSDGAQIV